MLIAINRYNNTQCSMDRTSAMCNGFHRFYLFKTVVINAEFKSCNLQASDMADGC